MCSLQDDDVNPEGSLDVDIKIDTIAGNDRKCVKCTNDAVIITPTNAAFCHACFVALCTHKFRSEFGKSRLVRDKERVLVAYSGGCGSSAMVHLIQEGLSKRASKKLRFIPSLIFIDESHSLSCEEREPRLETCEVVRRMQATGLCFYVYRLEQVMDSDLTPVLSNTDNTDTVNAPSIPESSTDSCRRLSSLLKSVKSLTAKESVLLVLRHRLLVSVARHLRCGKVALGDSSTRLAVRMISDITQGRGAQVPYEMSFADCRHGDVTFVRPLRDFSGKELTVYNRRNAIEPVFTQTVSTKCDVHASMDKLCERFVLELQANHSHTIPTICRTGEKLEVPSGDQSANCDDMCCLCGAPLDTEAGASSAQGATAISHAVCERLRDEHSAQKTICNGSSPDNYEVINTVTNAKFYDGLSAVRSDADRVDTVVAALTPRDVTRTAICDGVTLQSTSVVDEDQCQTGCCRVGTSSVTLLDSEVAKAVEDIGTACCSTGVGASQNGACCGTGAGCRNASLPGKMDKLSVADLQTSLCYGCRLVTKDLTDTSVLPPSVVHHAASHVRRRQMRNSIQEFLLTDES